MACLLDSYLSIFQVEFYVIFVCRLRSLEKSPRIKTINIYSEYRAAIFAVKFRVTNLGISVNEDSEPSTGVGYGKNSYWSESKTINIRDGRSNEYGQNFTN